MADKIVMPMAKVIKKVLIGIVIITVLPIFPIAGRITQVRKRLVCGRVVDTRGIAVARTVVSLYFGPGDGFDELIPGAATEPDGTFCIENNVRDLNESTSARVFVRSFCRLDDATLVDWPFWPHSRRDRTFKGKRIVVGPGSRTNVGDVGVQITYGHVNLRILDHRDRPLLRNADDWSPVWIRVRDESGAVVHASGLSISDIEHSVDLNQSSINLALPEGIWSLDVALAGVPSGTSLTSRAVSWLHVPGKLRIRLCLPSDARLFVIRKRKT